MHALHRHSPCFICYRVPSNPSAGTAQPPKTSARGRDRPTRACLDNGELARRREVAVLRALRLTGR
jgi:hypothetical protein